MLRPVGAVLSALGGLGTGKKVLLVVLASIVLMVGILYPPAQTYYQALRTEQKLQAEYTAVSDRQSYLEQQNKELKTDEGVESRAQEEFGWTKEGESAAIVTNPGETQDRSSALSSQFDPDSIHAPDTWYYKMLDTVFFVQQ